jgi:hypothetical protein
MSISAAQLRNCDTVTLRQYTIETINVLLSLYKGSFAAYRKRLAKKREAVRESGPCWRPTRPFASLPKSSQQRAYKKKSVLGAYYIAVEERGLPTGLAELVACQIGFLLFGKAPHGHTIRRYVARIEACGGPEKAPMEAYADNLSCPHLKARKAVP